MGFIARTFSPAIPVFFLVIPAKAGIQMRADAAGDARERDMVVVSRRWERGRPARNAALARGDTLILTFSHKGRRDPLVGICT